MKGFPEIIRDAMILLDQGVERVVIARGDSENPLQARHSAFQFRLRRVTGLPARLNLCAGESRSWLGEQWSDWRERIGWLGGLGVDLDDVLASDWRIVS